MLKQNLRMKYLMPLSFLAAFTVSASSPANAVEKKQADVVVVNNTGKDILQLNVAHKYSNEYFDDLSWSGILSDGMSTSGQVVEYNTGFGTTGRDWWRISWVYSDSSKVYYSDPNNFRGAIDVMEKVSAVAIPVGGAIAAAAVGAVCTVGTAGGCGGVTAAAVIPLVATSAAAISAAASGELLQGGSTDGFKQHILRDDDAGKIVKIYLEKDGEITIKSPSGVSETVYSSHDAETTPSQREELSEKIRVFKADNFPDLSKTWTSTSGDITLKQGAYGKYNEGTYGDDDTKTIKIKSAVWDENKQAMVMSGTWGRKGAELTDVKKNGTFSFTFVSKCKFEGQWSYLVPEMDGFLPKFNPWNGSLKNCTT